MNGALGFKNPQTLRKQILAGVPRHVVLQLDEQYIDRHMNLSTCLIGTI